MKYKLTGWSGRNLDITQGKMYEHDISTGAFRDDVGDLREIKRGSWEGDETFKGLCWNCKAIITERGKDSETKT